MSKHYALSPTEEAFAENLVGLRRYASVDEVVREGLRLLREHEAPAIDLESLRRLWREGVESGEHVDAEEVFDRLITKYQAMDAGRSS